MGKNSGPKSVSTLTKSQQTLMNQLINVISPGTIDQKYLGQNPSGSLIGKPATSYGGQIVPDLIPQYSQLLQMIQGFNPQAQSGLFNQASQALGPALSGRSTPTVNPLRVSESLPNKFFTQGIMNPLMHNFQTNIAPKIREGFAGVGAFSSAEGSSLANALSDQNVAAGQQFAQAQYQQRQFAQGINAQSYNQAQALNSANQNSALARQLQASQLASGLAGQQSMLPLQQAAAIGTLLEPFQQNKAQQSQANYQDFLRTTPENSPWTQLALGLISQQQKALYNPPNPLSQGIGNLGGLLALGGLATGGLGGGLIGGLAGLGSGLGFGANGSSNIFAGGF